MKIHSRNTKPGLDLWNTQRGVD